MKRSIKSVNIRPGVGFLSLLPHLNYKPWFALAEFVDNALQSFLSHRNELEQIEGEGCRLRVYIELDPVDGGCITIRDNAAGIHEQDYLRAFQPAALPPDRSGLSEFGIGMKSAACWFADYWTVRTSAFGETIERTVAFDTKIIVNDNIEDIIVSEIETRADSHYTEIVLTKLEKIPKGKTIAKIKEHLASIYRMFIRDSILELYFDKELLTCPAQKVLTVPFYKGGSEEAVEWQKEINMDLGLGLRAYGFAALCDKASTSHAGFALFRRNRLIQGSGEETYRPEYIFKHSNSFTYQRLFGEIHLEGFGVSHTKDGFQWEEHEETFLELLKEELDKEPLSLIKQAEGYRARLKPKELKAGVEAAAERTSEVIKNEVISVLQEQLDKPLESNEPEAILPPATALARREINVELNGCQWQITLELSDDPTIGDWIDLCEQPFSTNADASSDVRKIEIRLSVIHPFMERFGGAELSQIEPLVRIGVAIGLAEVIARNSGVRKAGAIRQNINKLLRSALSKP
jgi:hypothetical protein